MQADNNLHYRRALTGRKVRSKKKRRRVVAAELKAVLNAFGEHAYKIKINSTKSMTGHLLGAAGGVEAIATILSLHSQRIHPTINLDVPDPLCPHLFQAVVNPP